MVPSRQLKPPTQLARTRSVNQVQPSDLSLIATIQDHDERELAQMGYKQELRREFNKWSTVSYAISILGVLGSVPATFGIPIQSGGPATAVWTWLIGSVMAECIALSGTRLIFLSLISVRMRVAKPDSC
jgi:hypothetical protein